MTPEWERDAAQFEESRPTAPCGEPGCDCGYTIERLKAENARLREALARQHRTWRHLDRDEERPDTHSVYLTWHPDWGICSSMFETTGNFDNYHNPRWWCELPQPPKEEA